MAPPNKSTDQSEQPNTASPAHPCPETDDEKERAQEQLEKEQAQQKPNTQSELQKTVWSTKDVEVLKKDCQQLVLGQLF